MINLHISRKQPVKALLIMEALKEETRQKIIDLLLSSSDGLSLTEMQQKLGKTLPTLIFHINLLEKAGIISWKLSKRGRKTTKIYFAKEKLISIDIDIEIFSKAMNLKRLSNLLDTLIDKSIESIGQIPRKYSISEIMNILNSDPLTATALNDYLETYEEEFVKKLLKRYSDKILNLSRIEPDNLSKELRIDVYWVTKMLKELKLL